MSLSTPVQIAVPFAVSGLKNTIPASSDNVTGHAGYDQGFPPINMVLKAAGGIPPFGRDFNGIFYDNSVAIQYLEAGNGFVYNSTFSTAIGGYKPGARVLRTDGRGYWLNTVDNNTTDPEAAGAPAAGWVPDYTNGIAAVTMTGSNVTLTPLQYGKPVIVITGLLTANLNLIFPPIAGVWFVVNNTTGAFAITCKTAAGTGGVVTQGGAQEFYGDATNLVVLKGSTPTPLDNTQAFATTAFSNLTGGLVGNARNLKMSVAAASASATMTADEIIVETALGGAPLRLANFNKTINLATTGAGGMDTGSAPVSGFVGLYAIYNPTTATAALLAVNATSTAPPNIYGGANMPSGYTASGLVGIWQTNGSSQFPIALQLDRTVWFSPTNVLNVGAATSYSVVTSLSSVIPKGAKKWAANVAVTTTGAVASNGSFVAADTSGTGMKATINPVASAPAMVATLVDIPILTDQTAYYMNTSAGVTCSLNASSYTF